MIKGTWIEHRGHRIWFADYSGLAGETFVRAIHDTQQAFTSQNRPDGSGLILNDIDDAVIDTPALSALKETGVNVEPYVKKVAVIGVVGLKRMFLNIAVRFTGLTIQAFESRESALDWLVE